MVEASRQRPHWQRSISTLEFNSSAMHKLRPPSRRWPTQAQPIITTQTITRIIITRIIAMDHQCQVASSWYRKVYK